MAHKIALYRYWEVTVMNGFLVCEGFRKGLDFMIRMSQL